VSLLPKRDINPADSLGISPRPSPAGGSGIGGHFICSRSPQTNISALVIDLSSGSPKFPAAVIECISALQVIEANRQVSLPAPFKLALPPAWALQALGLKPPISFFQSFDESSRRAFSRSGQFESCPLVPWSCPNCLSFTVKTREIRRLGSGITPSIFGNQRAGIICGLEEPQQDICRAGLHI